MLDIFNEKEKIVRSIKSVAGLSPKERFGRFSDLISFIENLKLSPYVKQRSLEFREKLERQKRQAFLKFLHRYNEKKF